MESARNDNPPSIGKEGVEVDARSRIGIAYCKVRLIQRQDLAGHNTETVNGMVNGCKEVLAQAQQLVQGEQYAWTILNATVLVYQVRINQWRHLATLCNKIRGDL